MNDTAYIPLHGGSIQVPPGLSAIWVTLSHGHPGLLWLGRNGKPTRSPGPHTWFDSVEEAEHALALYLLDAGGTP